MNCYNCKYVKEHRNGVHSKCTHPDTLVADDKIIGILDGDFTMNEVYNTNREVMGVEFDPSGHHDGIADWPLKFDAVLVEKCSSWEMK